MGFALHRCCAAPNALGDPPAIAEDIVRNVVHGGRVEVRAVARYQQVPQIVTGQIRLFEGSLWATDYDAAEIDWNGLVVEGRKIVPAHLVVLDTSSADRTPRKQMARERAELQRLRQDIELERAHAVRVEARHERLVPLRRIRAELSEKEAAESAK